MRKTKLDIIKQVVEDQQHTKIKISVGNKSKTMILDIATANQILKLFSKAPLANIERINELPWLKLCSMAWGE